MDGNRVRIAMVCGTRPEIVKLAPLYHQFGREPWAAVEWIHTGQHGDMADEMLRCFDIRPHVRLKRDGETLHEFSLGCRMQLHALFTGKRYELCLVQGDTESAFLGALTAFYERVPVGHVEAGLRTYNLSRPFPEEGLRQMITRLARLHFAPTGRAASALLAEGVAHDRIFITGNTVVDAQNWAAAVHGIKRRVAGAGHVLVTVHRREHWGPEMKSIFAAVAMLARQRPELQFLFPVHLNPVVRDTAHAALSGIANVRLVEPLDYLAMQQALADATVVLTDSGGLQEEAPSYGVMVLVLRRETERPEAVEAGCARLVGPRGDDIVRETLRALSESDSLASWRGVRNPFGDGNASRRIIAAARGLLSPARSDRSLAMAAGE